MSLEKYIVRLYPRAWRERYEEEMLAMLEAGPCSLVDQLDLFFGALDAHLHPHLGTTGLAFHERMKKMLALLRRSLLVIFCASVGFMLGGVGFQKMTEYDDFTRAAQTVTLVGLSYNLIVVGGVVLFLSILCGGLPVVGAIVRSAVRQKRYGPLVLLATPVLVFAIFVGSILLLEAVFRPGHQLVPFWHLFLARGFFLAVLLSAILVSTIALCLAVVRSEIPASHFRFALLLSIPAIISMAVILASMLIWGLSLRNSVPQLFNSNGGIFGSSTPGSWLGSVVIMAVTATLAIIALVRGISARSVLKHTAA